MSLTNTAAILRRHNLRWDLTEEERRSGHLARCRDCGVPFRTAEEWLGEVCAVIPTPYPEFCDRAACRGLGSCPKDPTCAD